MIGRGRLILHPILVNKRSRFIFLIYLVLSSLVGILTWFKFESSLKQAGLALYGGTPAGDFLPSLLISEYFRGALIFATAVFASGLTAQYAVGAVRRIEEWLMAHERNLIKQPLKVRTGDQYSRLVGLINRLCGPFEKN